MEMCNCRPESPKENHEIEAELDRRRESMAEKSSFLVLIKYRRFRVWKEEEEEGRRTSIYGLHSPC
jgi:hypothetical protein